MKKNIIFITFIMIIIFITIITFIPSSFAQTTNFDTSFVYEISDGEAVDGDILIYTEQGLVRSNAPLSQDLFGVMQENPIIIVELDPDNPGKPIVKSGIAYVNVTNTNGEIKKGDLLTSSETPGKGQKADKSGYTLGLALEDLAGSEGKIAVSLDIKQTDLYTNLPPTANKFLKAFDNILLSSTENPEQFSRLVRYVTSALIMLGAFAISFFTFSRSMGNAVEAIGRNPLAKTSIYFSLIINGALAITIVGAGLITAFILIRL